MKREPLTDRDLAVLEKSYITPELAEQAGLFRVDSSEGARLLGRRNHGDYAGTVYPNILPGQDGAREYRIRRDNPDLEQQADGALKEKGKYLSPSGASNLLYFPPGIDPSTLQDISIPVLMNEGEKKCLATHRAFPGYLSVGLTGVWNFRGKRGKATNATGKRVNVVGVIPDFDRIQFTHRKAFILYDPNVATNMSVRRARADLARELQDRGAIVSGVDLPEIGLNGVDEILAAKGVEFVRELIDKAAMIPGARIAELAKLGALEYEKIRKAEAQKLNCRASVLDKLVAGVNPKAIRDLHGRALILPEVEPWPESVNGEEVLTEVARLIRQYVQLSDHAATVIALWILHTWLFDLFVHTPRLNITSPIKRCGKTLLLDVIGELVRRPLETQNLTTAVLFRVVESSQPTLLADEADTWIHDNDEKRGILNAGHKRGGQVLRCEGDSNDVRVFNVFAPVVLSGIGRLPGTLEDRSIIIRLERAKRGEIKNRFDSRHTARERELARKLARFAADSRASLEHADPVLPDAAFNRVADNWRPLYALADVAGWRDKAEAAFKSLVSSSDDQEVASMLLADVRQIFKAKQNPEALFSRELVSNLTAMADRPWLETNRGKPITEHWLAKRLRDFKIVPGDVHLPDKSHAKGYELCAFTKAFERYLENPQFPEDSQFPEKADSDCATVHSGINIGENENPNRANGNGTHGFKSDISPINSEAARLHGSKGVEDQVLGFPSGCDLDEINEAEAVRAEGCGELT